ncbi:hypothetical protein BH23PAT2_BH23PAT2_07240 [soil metagenome]
MIEVLKDEIVMSPGPIDAHAHPRVFDAVTDDQYRPNFIDLDGKAGLRQYSRNALASGFVGMIAMPNESLRLVSATDPMRSDVHPYPIANLDRLRAMQASISQESYIPTGIHFGIDPVTAYKEISTGEKTLDLGYLSSQFEAVRDEVLGLKLYGAETEGGYNVRVNGIPLIIWSWNRSNPDKPVVLHLEDEDVAGVLEQIADRKEYDVPLHVAHVSSRRELEAVMEAKQKGLNVTCEVTPHHLFMDESTRYELGGYGCMKPTLKSQDDIDFIWENIDQVDIFASDCAPHRTKDKVGEAPAYGVVNHTVMLPLLFGAAEFGRITYEQIYDKTVIAPRRRFNLPDDVLSRVVFDREGTNPSRIERRVNPGYDNNPFVRTREHYPMIGNLMHAHTSSGNRYSSSYPGFERITTRSHLLRPVRKKD